MAARRKPRLNLSGDPMLAFGINAYGRRLMRSIHRKAHGIGCPLMRFRQIYGYETEHGCAWMAVCRHNPSLSVTIWHVIGDCHIEEARQTCQEVIETTRGVFGVSWSGNWPLASRQL